MQQEHHWDNRGTGNSQVPRVVPALVRIRLLLGGGFNQFGWLWLCFSLCSLWSLGFFSDMNNLLLMNDDLVVTQGEIIAIIETNTEINDDRIYEYRYEYTVNSVPYIGVQRYMGGVVQRR